MEMAREFSEIWTTGDPVLQTASWQKLCSLLMSSTTPSGTQGRESWKQMIHGVFKVTLSCPCLLKQVMKTYHGADGIQIFYAQE